MTKTHVNCPMCKKEIKVETEMYLDGDVCYDVYVNEDQATESEDVFESMTYNCQNCKTDFYLRLDEDFWGEKDIPLHAFFKFSSVESAVKMLEVEFDFIKIELLHPQKVIVADDSGNSVEYTQEQLYRFLTEHIQAYRDQHSDEELMNITKEYL